MAYIAVPADQPGIRGLMSFRPQAARPLNQLANVLLQGESPLTPGERELIATYVSARNGCQYCQSVHGAVAAVHLGGNPSLVDAVKKSPQTAAINEKLKSLLAIAGQVQQGGKEVSQAHVDAARQCGASDVEIHDTVLIAAAFCMFNRYVDGLGTSLPDSPDFYATRGELLAKNGYSSGPPTKD